MILCCLLWARSGDGAALAAYEDAVLDLLPRHGGEIMSRFQGARSNTTPHEVQLYRFPDQAALDSYLADPDRAALAEWRDRVVERTELLPVTER